MVAGMKSRPSTLVEPDSIIIDLGADRLPCSNKYP